ncbi:MAG: substrate-binding domain-containing protein, partial [Anaerolineae bacterium]|nr:substrate-binding domain-containing protein [Anaerolineae bacterium]
IVNSVAQAAVGIAYDPDLVREGNWLHENGFEHTQALLDLEQPPTAIVASNDLMAFGAIQAAHERGLHVGADLSVTGFDDIDMAALVTPSLTTMRQPMAQMGEAAVDLLVRRIDGEPIDEPHLCLDTELIVRDSTGAVS